MMITPQQLSDLESFFKSATLPASVQLDAGVTITEIPKFIESHLAILRHSGNKPVYEAFYFRLLLLKDILAKS